MARNTETTTKFKVDISELKSGLRDANRAIALTNSEFKNATAGMDDWRNSADGISAKITQLKNVNKSYANILDDVSKRYDEIVEAEGENSESAQSLKIKMNQLQAAIKGNEAAIDKYENSLEDISGESETARKSLDDVGKEIKDTGDEAEKSSGKLKGFLGSLGKGIITGIGAAVTGLAAGLTAATESSKEFNDNMSKLETVAEDAGYTTKYAKDKFEDLYGILGDETAANTTVSNFMAMGTSQENLNSLLNSSAGIWAKYGDSIPLDGLAESVNETAKVSAVTGTLADALNWAGVNEDEFNESLEKCSDEQERQQLIVDTLNGLYGDLGEKYKENNKAVIDLNKAQISMKSSIAAIGTAFTPVLAMFTQFGAGLLSSIVPDIENMAAAFMDLTNGVEGAEGKIGGAVSNILNTIISTIVDMLPQITSIGVSIITGLANGIMLNSGQILDVAQQIILTLADALVTLLPQAVTAVANLIPQIITAIVELAPQLLMAAMELFSGLVDAITKIDIGAELANLISTICDTIMSALPQLLDAATTLFTGIVDAIPGVISSLMEALPGIIDTITNLFVSAYPQFVQAANTMFNALVDAIPIIIESLVTNLPSIIESIMNFIAQAIPQLLSGAISMFMTIVKAIPKIIPPLLAAIPQIINAIWNGLMSLPDKIWEALQQTFPSFTSWISNVVSIVSELPGKIWDWLCKVVDNVVQWGSNMVATAGEAIGNVVGTIIDTVSSLPGKMVEIGGDIVSGIWDGISGAAGWLWNKVTGFCSGIWDNITGFFGINSPSRLMRDTVGKFLPMGIGEGIIKNAKYAVDAMTDLGNNMLAPAKNIKNNLTQAAIPTNTIGGNVVNNYTFNQTNNSPKALSRFDIYRQSKNLLSAKGV